MILKLCRIHICVVIIFAWELELLIIMTIMTFMRMVCNQEANHLIYITVRMWYVLIQAVVQLFVLIIFFSALLELYRYFGTWVLVSHTKNFFDDVSVFTVIDDSFYYPVWCFFSMVHCVAIFKALNERSIFVVVFSSFIWWICT